MISLLKSWKNHTNPDGSVGGKVFDGAIISPSATIGRTSIVMPGATVRDGENIPRGTIVDSQGNHIRFD